jgi:hypothetical protein
MKSQMAKLSAKSCLEVQSLTVDAKSPGLTPTPLALNSDKSFMASSNLPVRTAAVTKAMKSW